MPKHVVIWKITGRVALDLYRRHPLRRDVTPVIGPRVTGHRVADRER